MSKPEHKKKNYIVEANIRGKVLVRKKAKDADEALDKADETPIITYHEDVIEHDVDLSFDDVEEEK